MKTNTQYLLERINNVEQTLLMLAHQLGSSNTLIAGNLNSLVENMRTTGERLTNEFVAGHFGNISGGASPEMLIGLIRQYLPLAQGGYPLTDLSKVEIPNNTLGQITTSGIYRKPNSSYSGSKYAQAVIAFCTMEGTLLYDMEFQRLRAISVVGELGLINAAYHGQFSTYTTTDAIHKFFTGLGRPLLKPVPFHEMEKQVLSEANCLTRHDLLAAGEPQDQTGICFVGEIDAPVFAYRYQLSNGKVIQVTVRQKEGEYCPSLEHITSEYWDTLPYATQRDFLECLRTSTHLLKEAPAQPVKNDARGE